MTQNILKHLAIIMDGNRRWSKQNGFQNYAGYESGSKKILQIVKWSISHNIKNLTLYAFSTENKNRSESEISLIKNIIKNYLESQEVKELHNLKVCTKTIGDITFFNSKTQDLLLQLEDETKHYSNLTLTIALCYSSKNEIASIARQIASSGKEITTEEIENYLQKQSVPEVDLLIRTGGKKRLSNFLLWQNSYSEIFFLETLWPDFCETDFNNAVNFFLSQKRNFGK